MDFKALEALQTEKVERAGDSGTGTQDSSVGGSSTECSQHSRGDQLEESSSSQGESECSGGFNQDELYFVPNKVAEEDGKDEDMVSMPKLSLEGRQVKEGVQSTPLKRQCAEDNEVTPKKMHRLSPAVGVKQGFMKPSFNRRTKALVLSKKRKRMVGRKENGRDFNQMGAAGIGQMKMGKGGVLKRIIVGAVRREMKDVVKSVSEGVREQLLEAVRQEVKIALDGFKSVLDERLTKETRQKSRSSCKKKNNGGCLSHNGSQLDDGKDFIVASAGLISASQSPRTADTKNECLSLPENAATQKVNGDQKEVETPQPKTPFNRLLRYAHSKSLKETLQKSRNSGIIKAYLEKSDSEATGSRSPSSDEASTVPNSPVTNNGPFLSMISIDSIKKKPGSPEESSLPTGEKAVDVNKYMGGIEVKKEVEESSDGHSSSTVACMTLVPYVKPTLSTTKVIIGLPKPELVPKPELTLKRYRENLTCKYCGKHFHNNSSLKQHTSFHQPHRPYECQHPDCDKAYKTRSELNRHLVVHTGQKNYECKECGKRFLRKQYLKTHLLRHDESLTWQCDLCTKIFVTKHDLDKHKVSYHKNGRRPFRSDDQQEPLALTYGSCSDDLSA